MGQCINTVNLVVSVDVQLFCMYQDQPAIALVLV